MMNIEEFLSGRSILIGKRLFVSIFILARRLEKEGIRNDVKKDEVQSKKSPSFKRASGFWLPSADSNPDTVGINSHRVRGFSELTRLLLFCFSMI